MNKNGEFLLSVFLLDVLRLKKVLDKFRILCYNLVTRLRKSTKKKGSNKMKIALIIYVVTIVIYWVGALSVITSVAKYLKEHSENKYHTTISKFSALARIIIFSLIPILNVITGAVWIFDTDSVINSLKEYEDV